MGIYDRDYMWEGDRWDKVMDEVIARKRLSSANDNHEFEVEWSEDGLELRLRLPASKAIGSTAKPRFTYLPGGRLASAAASS